MTHPPGFEFPPFFRREMLFVQRRFLECHNLKTLLWMANTKVQEGEGGGEESAVVRGEGALAHQRWRR